METWIQEEKVPLCSLMKEVPRDILSMDARLVVVVGGEVQPVVGHKVQGWMITGEVGVAGVLLSVSSFKNPLTKSSLTDLSLSKAVHRISQRKIDDALILNRTGKAGEAESGGGLSPHFSPP